MKNSLVFVAKYLTKNLHTLDLLQNPFGRLTLLLGVS